MPALTSWRRLIPKWAGNSASPDPFALEIKRQTIAERRDFSACLEALRARERADPPDPPALADWISLLSRVCRGPLAFPGTPEGAPALSLDGVPVNAGDFGALVRLAWAFPVARDSLLIEILEHTIEVNGADSGK